MENSPHVVIIGGSYAGIKAAEIILGSNKSVRLTMISSSSHAYFNVAAPRALVEPAISEKLFFPVEEKLQKLGREKATFVLGKVEKVDHVQKTVLYQDSTKSDTTISYDFLVIASGTKSHSPAFKLDGDYKETKDSLRDLHKKITDASDIIVLGGGATAVEVAGEIGYTYGKDKSVSIYTGASGPLMGWLPTVTDQATKQLEDVNVKVVNNIRFSKLEQIGDRTEVTFDDESSKTVDLVIPAFGVSPNSSFLDDKLLDSQGYVIVDDNLAVKNHPEILAFGDIVSERPCTVIDIERVQATTFKSTVGTVIFKENQKSKPLKKSPNLGLVPISRNGGVGLLFGWSAPSFLVKFLKSKDFMISRGAQAFS